jgi:Fic family protein
MTESKPRKWKPVDALGDGWKQLHDQGITVLVDTWLEQVAEMKERGDYDPFVAKLRREWAIETGVLERLYDIKESPTRVLIEHGLDASLLSTSDVDKPVEEVMALIRDQESAIESMYDFVEGSRTLSLGYIRELHAVLTAHQPTAESEDASGNIVAIPLIRGEWRKTEAQVTDSDGKTWFYCEPALLELQMLDLVSEYERQTKEGVPVEIRAAWLHHRFTLVHPFQDGNGRVARCLATPVLLREGWFPLVVNRSDKLKYIAALRSADDGDLKPLIDVFNHIQRRTIRSAFGTSEELIDDRQTISEALAEAQQRLQSRMEHLAKADRDVRTVADVLRLKATERLVGLANETNAMLQRFSPQYSARQDGVPYGHAKDYYYRHQVVECAKLHGYFADLKKYHAWTLAALMTDQRVELIFSFHGIGRASRGVLCCSAISCTKANDGTIEEVHRLTDEPFEFTHHDDPIEVSQRFSTWMNAAISRGIQRWSAEL